MDCQGFPFSCVIIFLRILTRFIDIKNLLPVFFRLIVSVAWIAHIVIYLLISPPLSPFLNEVFIKLDDIWGTFRIYFSCLYVVIILLNGYDFDMRLLFSTRSFGHCCICVLLLLPPPCSHCWGHDAWDEISFHYYSSNEVMIFPC